MINKLQKAGSVPKIESVPTQSSTTYVYKAPIEVMLKAPRKKLSKQEQKEQKANNALDEAILKQTPTGRASGIGNTDLPLQIEHPELSVMFLPEITANGVIRGGLKIAGGLAGSNVASNTLGTVGSKIDNALSTELFAPTLSILGGLGGYALGSGITGLALSKLPKRYDNVTVESADYKGYGVDDQTPKYNSMQIETIPEVSVVRAMKPWRTDPTKVNSVQRFYLRGQEGRGYFELVKDLEPGNYSVHFKPSESTNPRAFSEIEKQALFQAVANAVPEGRNLSTWGSVSRGGIAGINRFGNLGFYQTGIRPLVMKDTGEQVNVPIFTKRNPLQLIVRSNYKRPVVTRIRNNMTFAELEGVPKQERNNKPVGLRVVNRDGSINWDNVSLALRNLHNSAYSKKGYFNYSILSPTSNGKNWGVSRPAENTLAGHTLGVVKTAQSIPVPKGSSRAELVRSALVHDIGKLYTGQEGSNPIHGDVGESFIRELGFPEFNSPQLHSAVRYHMSDDLGQFSRPWMKRDPFTHTLINYDLLKALQASDVARGLSYDQAAARFPQLFTYVRENPIKIHFAEGNTVWQLQNIVNPILRREGYPTIKRGSDINPQLNDLRQRHRSFYRGVRDPEKSVSANITSMRNAENAGRIAERVYGTNTSENRMLASLETIPLDATGQGRADLFKVMYDRTNLPYHVSDWLARRLKISPKTQDALYLSGSTDILNSFSDVANSRSSDGMAAKVTLPFEPIRKGESYPEFMERTDFQLYNGANIRSNRSPMSIWQKYEVPYRLQTGRSLQEDMKTEWLKEHQYPFSNKSTTHLVDSSDPNIDILYKISGKPQPGHNYENPWLFGHIANHDDLHTWFDRTGIKFEPIWEKDGKIAYNSKAVEFLKRLDGALGRYDYFDFIKVLRDHNLISQKLVDLYPKVTAHNRKRINQIHDELLQLRGGYRPWGEPISTEKEGSIKKLESELNDLYDDDRRRMYEFFTKYVLNKNTLYKIKNEYYKMVGKKETTMSPEFKKYMYSDDSIIKFMRSRGVVPLWDMPSFGKYQVFSTNGGTWGKRPASRNRSTESINPQGIVVGNKGERVLEVTKILSPDEYKSSVKKAKNEGRDKGRRFEAEGLLEITRKTFKQGGILKLKTVS